MGNSRFLILLYRWHAWVGLLSGLFLIVICVSGSVAVFRPEIERAVDWGDYDFNIIPDGEPISIEGAIATAEAAYPGGQVTLARYPDFGGSWQSHGQTYAVTLARGKGQGSVTVLIDPYRDKIVATKPPERGWGDFTRQLHVRFLYGSYWGRWIVGFFGLTLVFSTVSGLLIFTRFNAGSWNPKWRWGRGARIITADAHKIVGLGSVAFNLIFGVTGAVIGLEGLYRKYVMSPERPAVARIERVKDLAPGLIEQSVARSRELIPGGVPAFVTLAHARTGMIRVSVETPVSSLVKEGASSVAFSAKTGDVIDVYDARRASAAGRFYYAMEPLHFGRLGGAMWVKLIWGLMGLSGGFLSITGFAIYVLRKRKPRSVPVSPVPANQPLAVQPAAAFSSP
ncbi:MAG TPA: PepSY-associated TM helix domain-containing protein [Tepidisphaeraceae bacterium]|nr:PepSY-associated TM helix domain-containing protein [Tepidisphaeraceae bacterium]